MRSDSEHPAPWDVYAEELFHHRYGYPLWMPDPSPERSEWEVEIADVGYLRDGEFLHLVRTSSPPEEDCQPEGRLPDDYVPFNLPKGAIRGPREKVNQPVLYSRTIKSVDLSAAATVAGSSTGLPIGAGANFGFQCSNDKGALLVLSPNGEETYITCKRHIIDYVREHFSKWVLLANSQLGLELKEEDIVFVSSVMKTSRWGVAAFYGSQRGAQGSLSLDIGPGGLGSAGITMDLSKIYAPGVWHRTGPPHARRRDPDSLTLSLASTTGPCSLNRSSTTQPSFGTGSSVSISSSATVLRPPTVLSMYDVESSSSTPVLARSQESRSIPEKADQCIFFHYYKAKHRIPFLGLRIKAAAGSHELPGDPDGPRSISGMLAEDGSSHGGPELDFEMVSSDSKPYDPVNAALDYILENSAAEMAIASDLDLYALFKDQDFPRDIAEQLVQFGPQVDVDENGVGTLAVDLSQSRERVEAASDGTLNMRDATCSRDSTPYDKNTPDMDINDAQSIAGRQPSHHAALPPPTTSKGLSVANTEEGLVRHAIGAIHDGSITALAYSADGRYLASGAEAECIIIWNTHDNTVKRRIVQHGVTVSAVAFSPTGDVLASASPSGMITLWKVEWSSEAPRAVYLASPIYSLMFTSDGSKLVGGVRDGTFVLRMADNSIIRNDNAGTPGTLSADGQLMATGGTGITCRIWEVANLDNSAPKSILSGHSGVITSASFSFDGERIVTGSFDCSCRIWNTSNGSELFALHEHTEPVWSVFFSPDGYRVVSGSSDSTVKVWDAWAGVRLLSLQLRGIAIDSIAYSPDGAYIASASSDTVRLWNAEDGTLVRTYHEHSDYITSMHFSPDGRTLASGSHDGTVYIRSLPAPSPFRSPMEGSWALFISDQRAQVQQVQNLHIAGPAHPNTSHAKRLTDLQDERARDKARMRAIWSVKGLKESPKTPTSKWGKRPDRPDGSFVHSIRRGQGGGKSIQQRSEIEPPAGEGVSELQVPVFTVGDVERYVSDDPAPMQGEHISGGVGGRPRSATGFTSEHTSPWGAPVSKSITPKS